MAHIYGTSLFCFILFWLANRNPAFAEVLGASCDTGRNCSSIANSTCYNITTCVCPSGFVLEPKNLSCLQVNKELGSSTEETMKTDEGSPEISTTKDNCADNETCNTNQKKKSPCPDGNCSTQETEYITNSSNHTATERRERLQEKPSGGSSVVPISFLAVISVVNLVM